MMYDDLLVFTDTDIIDGSPKEYFGFYRRSTGSLKDTIEAMWTLNFGDTANLEELDEFPLSAPLNSVGFSLPKEFLK